MTETMTMRRPGPVTFVGVALYIKAVIAVVAGIALIVERNNAELLRAAGQSSDFLVGTAIGEFIVAGLILIVASAIMSGRKWARLGVAVVVAIRIAAAVYWMIVHSSSGLEWHALLNVGIAIFVLWALYGNDESQTYFEGHA